MIFHKDELTKLFNDTKILKTRVIMTIPGNEQSPGIAIGTTEELSFLKVMTYPNDKLSIFGTTVESGVGLLSITELIKNSDDSLFTSNYGKDYVYVPDVNRFNTIFLNRVYCAYINIINMINSSIRTTTYTDVQLNQDFINIQNSYGEYKWKIDEYHSIYLYNGLINVNKSDIVTLNIYDLANNQFICVFSVTKSKKCVISTFLLCKTI
jgi:hypothetical protein